MRLMYKGVFDRFPRLKIVLGHMGEGLSWILPRTDSTFRLHTPGFSFRIMGHERSKMTSRTETRGPMKKTFLEYFQNKFIVNTSGMPRTSALLNSMAETTAKHIMFSVDYPYESITELRQWCETIPGADETWKDIGYRNAIRLFDLPLDLD